MSKIEKCGGVTLKTEIVEDDRSTLSREVCFLIVFFVLKLFYMVFCHILVRNEISVMKYLIFCFLNSVTAININFMINEIFSYSVKNRFSENSIRN